MIYFFYGDEEFNISNEIKKFKSSLDKNFIEMSYKTYQNPKFPDLIAILKSQPMMFGKMLIVIDCLNYICGKKEDGGFDDNQLEQLSQALEDSSENIDIIFTACVLPDGKKKIDKRKKIFKLLSKYNPKEFVQIPSYKVEELQNWIIKQAKNKGFKISSDVADTMLIQVGSNLRLLDSELEKLNVYAGKETVTKDMVKEICTTNEDLFVFADYLTTNNIKKAIEEYQKLLAKKHPLEILSALQTMLHRSILIKANSKKQTQDEIAKLVNIHPYRVKLEIQRLKNVSLRELVKLKKNITVAEYKIKSGKSVLDMEREVEYAILR